MAGFKKAINATKIIGIVFAAFGLLFAVIGIIVSIEFSNFAANAEQTTAVITNIEAYRTKTTKGRYKTRHDVYIKYSVDGATYKSELGYYNSGMSIGDEIEVYYDPENPNKVRGKDSPLGFIFAGIGGVFAVMGICIGVIPAVKHGKKKKLIETGTQTTGIITGVTPDRSVRINGRHPYKAECEVIDEFTGERYLYSSDGVMGDISYLIGQSVAVYYDPNDRSKYYIDLDSVNERADNTAPVVHDFR